MSRFSAGASFRCSDIHGIAPGAVRGQSPSTPIRLRHLRDHQGGWVRDTAMPSLHPGTPAGFDPCSGSALRLMGQDLSLNHVVSTRDVARYMYGEPLQYTPGTATLPFGQRYSNFGYMLIGMAVERIAGKPFHDYLRDSVLSPIGIADVFVANSLATRPREVQYNCTNAVPSVFRPDLDPSWMCEPYGGLATEVSPGSGGLLASAPPWSVPPPTMRSGTADHGRRNGAHRQHARDVHLRELALARLRLGGAVQRQRRLDRCEPRQVRRRHQRGGRCAFRDRLRPGTDFSDENQIPRSARNEAGG